jgi:hypothetical protein
MGWTGEYVYGTMTYAEEKARVLKVFEWAAGESTFRVLQVSNVRPNWYVAIECIAPAGYNAHPYVTETLPDGRVRFVFAAVMLCRRYKDEWTRKEVEESSGPTDARAPESLLDLLSPLVPPNGNDWDSAKWAADWRARCRTHAEAKRNVRKLKEGQRITFPRALSFGAYGESARFMATGRPGVFLALDMGGTRVRINTRTLRAGFEVEA